MKIVRQLDVDVWREFVDNHPQGQIFHTPEMFQVFERTEGYQPTLWAAVDDDNRPLALLLPVQITLRDGILRRFTTRAVVYGSVLCAPGPNGREAMRTLLRTYNQEVQKRFLFTELRNLVDISDLQPMLIECGFAYEEHLNFLMDIARPQEEIWTSMRSNARRNINKARQSQVIIEEINDPNRISAVYVLLENTYKRLQVPLVDSSLFQSAFEVLYPQGMFKILLSKVKDIDIGVLTLLLYKDIVYYWYAGIVKEYASYRPADLLVWHALEWGQQNGFRIFDFGGAGKPDEEYGVRDFKAKFRGEPVNYGRNTCVHAPVMLKLSQIGYQLFRRFLC